VTSVTFEDVSLEDDMMCRYDSLTLYDGSGADARPMGTYCTAAPDALTSSGPSLFVVFKSDSDVSERGFSLRWNFVRQDSRGRQRHAK